MKIRDKRKAGKILERDGIAQRIINLAIEISEGSYKEAMSGAGRIAELVDSATYDYYWTEKVNIGRQCEQGVLFGLIEGKVERDDATGCVSPREP